MIDKKDLVAIRNFELDDYNFILATFLRGLYYGDTYFREVNKAVFMTHYHAVVERLLRTPGVSVKIACLKDDPGVILGYSIYKGPRLDFVFIKRAWRSIGIAKSLVPTTITTVSHLTKVGISIFKKHPNLEFNPFDLT